MNSANLVGNGLAIERTTDLSKATSKLSLLTAAVATQAYLIRAAFFTRVLTPIEVYVIDRQTHRRLLSGQIGDIEEVFHWDGLLPTMLISVLVFAVSWVATRVIARLFASYAASIDCPDRNRRSATRRLLSVGHLELEQFPPIAVQVEFAASAFDRATAGTLQVSCTEEKIKRSAFANASPADSTSLATSPSAGPTDTSASSTAPMT